MTVTVNGEPHDLPRGQTVARLVTTFTEQTAGVAVAVNDAVVPRGAWSTTELADGDRVEVLTAVQGG
ncbi:MAG TPA: sulfur carrier protein ThiS [Actinomycetes bacterium]